MSLPGPSRQHDADEASFTIWRVDDVDVVRIAGALDFAAAVRLRLTLFGRLDAGARHLVVDMTPLGLIDGSAVNILLRIQDRLGEAGGTLITPGASGLVLRVLEIAGVAKQLEAYDPIDPRLADRSADTTGRIDTEPAGRHGSWGDEVNAMMGRLGTLPATEVAARRSVREHAVELCLPFAERLARRFHGLGEPAANLNQLAALGLLKAVDGYDPALGTDFPSYATPTIVGELKRYFRDRGWSIRVPRRLQDLRIQVNKIRDSLGQELGRSPTAADIADRLEVAEQDVLDAMMAASAYRSTSLFTPVGDDDEGPTLADRLGAEDGEYAAVETHQLLQPLLAQLPARELNIITMRFFGNMTQNQIAERCGISQMHVSRLLTRTLSWLREHAEAADWA